MEGLVRGGKDDPSPQNVALWLEHTRPDHPLVAMLAGADQPRLRLLALGALREHPTSENRQILARLLDDADPTVRTAAEEVAERLKGLAAESPSRYASDSPSCRRSV
jgi:HEAT repeat protein